MRYWMLHFGLIALFLDTAAGQAPATLTLRAKLRDFKEYVATDATTHPDFENDALMGCGGRDLGFVKNLVDTTGSVIPAMYPGDNRNPALLTVGTARNCYTSFARFDEWYNDKPPVNRRFYIDLVLTRNAQGLYTFNDDEFMPLNTGAAWKKFLPADPDPFPLNPAISVPGNWGFTMELHTAFTYLAGQNQVFTFKGDDDVWVFINGKLVIDLGGLHDQITGTVNMDAQAAALGLQNGASYPLDFFFAERHSSGSHCQITTSLQLGQMPQLPMPVASPPGQTFRGSIDVGLSVPGHPDAQIRYTLDGTDPGPASPLYSAALAFTNSTVLKAKAFKTGFLPSDILTETYVLDRIKLPKPIATPPGQGFKTNLPVALSVPGHADAVIRYTLDGTDPDSTSPVYSIPLNFTASDTLKARAFKPLWLPSDMMVEVYLLEVPPNVITLRMDSTLGKGREGIAVTYSDAVLKQPIAAVALVGGSTRCLNCTGGSQDPFLRPGIYPEWTVSSRKPFHYDFRIYDHLGQFVVEESGDVTAAMIDLAAANAEGYRAISFRWIPVAHDRSTVGTGVYILRGRVVSDGGRPGGGIGKTETSLLRTFGYLRRD